MKTFLLCLLFTSIFTYSFSQAGTLDPGFGNGGFVTFPGGTIFPGSVTKFQPDGKLLNATGGTPPQITVSRFNLDGTPDASFGNGTGKVTVTIPAAQGQGGGVGGIALQADGKIILVAGVSANERLRILIRLNRDGTLDPGFGNNGIAEDLKPLNASEFLGYESVLTDGSIVLLVSNFPSVGRRTSKLYKYNSDGSRAQNYTAVLPAEFDGLEQIPLALTVDPLDRIIAGGAIIRNTFVQGPFFARLNSNLTFDPSFGPLGLSKSIRSSYTQYLTTQPDAKILAVVPQSGMQTMYRVSTDGSLDLSFGTNGMITTSSNLGSPGSVRSDRQLIILQEDGKILIGGVHNNSSGVSGNFAIERLLPDGTHDPSFGTNGVVVTDFGGDERITNMVIVGQRLYVYGNGIIAAYLLSEKEMVTCPSNINTSTDAGTCSKVLSIDPKSVSVTAKGVRSDGKLLSDPFPKGTTDITWYNGRDERICSQSVTINDIEAPMVTNLKTGVITLRFSSQNINLVLLAYKVSDNCGVVSRKITVTPNEPTYASGDGNWEILNDHTAMLRTHSGGQSKDRTYTVTVVAVDASANESIPVKTTITIPKSKDKDKKWAAPNTFEVAESDGSIREGLRLSVSPNPAPNNFNMKILDAGSNQRLELRIFDVSGRVVERRMGIVPGQTLTVGSNLKGGVYFAEVTGGKEKKIVKLVKQ